MIILIAALAHALRTGWKCMLCIGITTIACLVAIVVWQHPDPLRAHGARLVCASLCTRIRRVWPAASRRATSSSRPSPMLATAVAISATRTRASSPHPTIRPVTRHPDVAWPPMPAIGLWLHVPATSCPLTSNSLAWRVIQRVWHNTIQ